MAADRAAAEAGVQEERDDADARRWGASIGAMEAYGRVIAKTAAPLRAGGTTVLMFNKAQNPIGGDAGRGLHSSTIQHNMSRF